MLVPARTRGAPMACSGPIKKPPSPSATSRGHHAQRPRRTNARRGMAVLPSGLRPASCTVRYNLFWPQSAAVDRKDLSCRWIAGDAQWGRSRAYVVVVVPYKRVLRPAGESIVHDRYDLAYRRSHDNDFISDHPRGRPDSGPDLPLGYTRRAMLGPQSPWRRARAAHEPLDRGTRFRRP
jgi:hypothetical protein